MWKMFRVVPVEGRFEIDLYEVSTFCMYYRVEESFVINVIDTLFKRILQDKVIDNILLGTFMNSFTASLNSKVPTTNFVSSNLLIYEVKSAIA